jgi:hypothetical protein
MTDSLSFLYTYNERTHAMTEGEPPPTRYSTPTLVPLESTFDPTSQALQSQALQRQNRTVL